ncbi:hypothetical protein [Streptomyces griseoloalbus]|uniref:Uncharacterized protein n=1 Tax=Streptomyces griseoloalbus TaxID=67303 RepID=A0A7W8BIQ1_9ACTN|nr:hypothetical protein [Streptomyces albaduncus]MBB5124164.1 hypothetical protein [Streptomyces albaduncus]GGW33069.1 hypothetical protein GCM10010340_08450 [Streptomyces albaduncus]
MGTGEGPADTAFDVDVAWAAVTRSRERHDASGEARALTVLGQALDEAGRSDEADYLIGGPMTSPPPEPSG